MDYRGRRTETAEGKNNVDMGFNIRVYRILSSMAASVLRNQFAFIFKIIL